MAKTSLRVKATRTPKFKVRGYNRCPLCAGRGLSIADSRCADYVCASWRCADRCRAWLRRVGEQQNVSFDKFKGRGVRLEGY